MVTTIPCERRKQNDYTSMVTTISCERFKQNDYTSMVTTISCEWRKRNDYANMVTTISCERRKQNDYINIVTTISCEHESNHYFDIKITTSWTIFALLIDCYLSVKIILYVRCRKVYNLFVRALETDRNITFFPSPPDKADNLLCH